MWEDYEIKLQSQNKQTGINPELPSNLQKKRHILSTNKQSKDHYILKKERITVSKFILRNAKVRHQKSEIFPENV